MTHVKGTWLASAVRVLSQAGQRDTYLRTLDPRYRPALENIDTGEWHPVSLLLAHYDACERLQLEPEEIITLAGEVSKRAQGTVLDLTVKLAASTVVTPWVVMAQLNRLWARVARGGGIGVYKLGPKDARVEVIQFPGSRYRYCELATRGILQAALGRFCTRLFVTEMRELTSPMQLAMRVAWA